MEELILFLISILPIVVIGYYVYKKDQRKEPPKMLIKLFLAGMGSCILVLIIGLVLEKMLPFFGRNYSDLNLWGLVIHVFVGIALIEELVKWIMVYKFSYKHEVFDDLFDMIVYSVFVALGFAYLENLMYVYQSGIGTGLLRAITAVPGHASDGIFMGYYLGLAKLANHNGRKDLCKKYFVFSLLIPILLHGIYDYCLLSENFLFIFLFYIFIVFNFLYAFRKLKKVALIQGRMKDANNYCPNCGTPIKNNFCSTCGRKND